MDQRNRHLAAADPETLHLMKRASRGLDDPEVRLIVERGPEALRDRKACRLLEMAADHIPHEILKDLLLRLERAPMIVDLPDGRRTTWTRGEGFDDPEVQRDVERAVWRAILPYPYYKDTKRRKMTGALALWAAYPEARVVYGPPPILDEGLILQLFVPLAWADVPLGDIGALP